LKKALKAVILKKKENAKPKKDLSDANICACKNFGACGERLCVFIKQIESKKSTKHGKHQSVTAMPSIKSSLCINYSTSNM